MSAIEQRFSYHRAVAPMMWAFVALASIELVVVHMLVSFWSRGVALALSALSLVTVAWLVRMIASMRRLPVVLTDDALVLRVGTLKSVTVPVAQVAGLRQAWDAEALKAGVLNLALIAYPNVVIDLTTPIVTRRRTVTAVAHRLDDPQAFARAIEALGARA